MTRGRRPAQSALTERAGGLPAPRSFFVPPLSHSAVGRPLEPSAVIYRSPHPSRLPPPVVGPPPSASGGVPHLLQLSALPAPPSAGEFEYLSAALFVAYVGAAVLVSRAAKENCAGVTFKLPKALRRKRKKWKKAAEVVGGSALSETRSDWVSETISAAPESQEGGHREEEESRRRVTDDGSEEAESRADAAVASGLGLEDSVEEYRYVLATVAQEERLRSAEKALDEASDAGGGHRKDERQVRPEIRMGGLSVNHIPSDGIPVEDSIIDGETSTGPSEQVPPVGQRREVVIETESSHSSREEYLRDPIPVVKEMQAPDLKVKQDEALSRAKLWDDHRTQKQQWEKADVQARIDSATRAHAQVVQEAQKVKEWAREAEEERLRRILTASVGVISDSHVRESRDFEQLGKENGRNSEEQTETNVKSPKDKTEATYMRSKKETLVLGQKIVGRQLLPSSERKDHLLTADEKKKDAKDSVLLKEPSITRIGIIKRVTASLLQGLTALLNTSISFCCRKNIGKGNDSQAEDMATMQPFPLISTYDVEVKKKKNLSAYSHRYRPAVLPAVMLVLVVRLVRVWAGLTGTSFF